MFHALLFPFALKMACLKRMYKGISCILILKLSEINESLSISTSRDWHQAVEKDIFRRASKEYKA